MPTSRPARGLDDEAHGDDLAQACQLLSRLPVETLERLAVRFTSPSALRRRREDERDGCYRALAVDHPAIANGRQLASALATELDRYRASAWRYEQGGAAPTDTRRALMHRILTLSDGRTLSASSIRRVLAGALAQKQ